MRLDGLHHVGLAVSDFIEALDWWKANFGLELISKWRDGDLEMGMGMGMGMVGRGEVRVELFCKAGSAAARAKGSTARSMSLPGWNHVAIRVHDLGGALEALRASGVVILSEWAEAPLDFA